MAQRLTSEQRRLRAVTEAEFQQQVLDFAKLCGWTHRYHTMTSQKNGAFMTAVTSRGFPDLILVRPLPDDEAEIVVWELKRELGTTTAEQDRWIELLLSCGLETRVVRPSDWDYVEARLRR